MHILKSRNPVWLILDIVITVWLWRAGALVPALFFTFDSFIQLVYTIFPDAIDAQEKSKNFRAIYTIFFLIAIFFLIRHLTAERII